MNKLIVNVELQDNRIAPDGFILIGHDFDKLAITANIETNEETVRFPVKVDNIDLYNYEQIEVIYQSNRLNGHEDPRIRFNTFGEMVVEPPFASVYIDDDIDPSILSLAASSIYDGISYEALKHDLLGSMFDRDEGGCYWGRPSIVSASPDRKGYSVALYETERFGGNGTLTSYFAVLRGEQCKTNGVQAVRVFDEDHYLEALRDATYFRKDDPCRAAVLVTLFDKLLHGEPELDQDQGEAN